MSMARRRSSRRAAAGLSTRQRLTTTAVGVAALLLSGLPLAGAAQAAGCVLTPKLNDVTVNQGLGSNQALARGKDTLVKLYLSLPDCANTAAGDQITISSSSTITTSASNATGTVLPQFTVPQYNTGGFGLGPATGAPYVNQPGDPVFLIPGSSLQPTDSAVFTLTVTANIAYTATPGAGSTSTRGTGPVSFSSTPAGSAITATFERRTNALRILVVKMVDPLTPNTFDSLTKPNAHTAVDTGMAQLSRLLPVPNGIHDLNCSPTVTLDCGGLRYSFATGSINLRAVPSTVNSVTTYYNLVNALNPNTKVYEYCNAGSDLVFAQLESMRQNWNSANPLTPADRVIGAVDEANSLGTTTPNATGCADGMGATPSGTTGSATTAWVRACYQSCLSGSSTGPSITGALLGMELSHNIGLVPAARADGTGHSPNIHADSIPVQAPNRTFYLPGRSQVSSPTSIGDSHAVMDYASDPVSAWNDATTLFEQRDWGYWQCALGGVLNTECGTQANSVGTQLAVPGGGLFTLTGSVAIDPATQLPSAAGTNVRDSFVSPNQALQTVPSPSSPYRLIQTGPTGVCTDTGVPVASADEHVSVGAPVVDAHVNLSDIAVPFAAGCANRVELHYLSGSSDTVLYARNGGSPAPQVTARTVAGLPGPGPVSTFLASAPNQTPEPELSADGKWLAINAGATGSEQVGVAATAAGAAGPVFTTLTSPPTSSEAAWRYDSGTGLRMLAFIGTKFGSAGDVYTVPVDTGGAVPVFGTPTQLTSGQKLEDPSWSRDGTRLVVSGSGNILTVPSTRNPDGTFVTPTVLVKGGAAPSPAYNYDSSWSHTAGDDRIAFSAQNASGSKIFTVDPDAATPTSTISLLADNTDDPKWDDNGRIVFSTHQAGQTLGNIGIVRSDGSALRLLTSNTTGGTPGPVDEFASLAQGRVFFERYPAPVPSSVTTTATPAIDSMTLTDPTGPAVSITANGLTPAQLAVLRADVFSTCPQPGSAASPVSTGLTAFQTTASSATFSASVDTTGTCGGASTLTTVLNDGFQAFAPVTAGTASPAGPQAPQAAVVNPLASQSYLQYATIPASGVVRDVQDGDLTSSAQWSLRDASQTLVASGTGGTVDFRPPAATGWAPGSYTLTVAATNSAGVVGSQTLPITILADANRNGIADSVEQQPCFLLNNFASDPYGPWRDYDSDGLVNIDDPAPCTASTYYLAQETFNPQRLNVYSTGQPVTVDIALTFNGAIAKVAPSTVQIKAIQGVPVSGFTNIHWSVTGTNTAVAQFNRTDLENYLIAHKLLNRDVAFQVGGDSGTVSFDGSCSSYIAG